MKNLLLVGAVALAGCGDLAAAVGGSCVGSQTVAGMNVQLCTESPTLTLDQQATLNSTCRSGALGSTANTWQMGASCATANRVGGCQRVVNGINVISWVYPNGSRVDANAVRSFCGSIQATYVNP